jgi:hypothetical protein
MFSNNEYDAVGACLLHFFRSGNLRALEAGLAGAEHSTFVDHIHYSLPYPGDVGMQWVHSHRHFGHHFGDRPDKFHVGFVQGMIWHSYLTGDMAGIRAAAEIADWASALVLPLSPHRRQRAQPEEFTWAQRRIVGNALLALMTAYEATENEIHLKAASQLVDWVFKWENPIHGGLPAHDNGRMGMFGRWSRIIHAGTIAYNEWVESPDVDRMLERFARALLASDSAQIAGEGRLFAYVYTRTWDPLFLSARSHMEAGNIEHSIRNIGLNMSHSPWFIGALAGAGAPSFDSQAELTLVPAAPEDRAEQDLVFVLRNTGHGRMEGIQPSLQPGIAVRIVAAPERVPLLEPGQSAQLRYRVRRIQNAPSGDDVGTP